MKSIFSIIVIVLSILSFVLFTVPQYGEVQLLQLREDELSEVLDNALRLQETRDELLVRKQSFTEPDLVRLEKLIPENSDNVKLILEMQQIAERFGLEIRTASAQADDGSTASSFDVETKDYGIIALNFDLLGPYQNFLSFLATLENNLRIVDINAIALQPETQTELDENGNLLGGGLETYSYSLNISTYWLKDNI